MIKERRAILLRTMCSFPIALLGQTTSAPASSSPKRVRSGEDRFGEHRLIGASVADFKVSARDTQGGLFVMEHKHLKKGGPARHLHHNEDEWLYVLEGSYIVEVDKEQSSIGPGDSVLIPRRTSHAFAFVGDGIGRMLVAFSPVGKMEESFRAFKDRQGAYSRWDNPEEMERARSFGMELLGPPLSI